VGDFFQKAQDSAERLVRGSVRASGTALEWIDRRAAVYRLEGHIRGLVRQRRDLLMEIGKQVYALHKAGKVRNKDVLANCESIDQLGEQVEDLQAQIEAIRRPDRGLQVEVELDEDEPLTEEADEAAPGQEQPAEAADEQAVQEAPEPPVEPEATEQKDAQDTLAAPCEQGADQQQ